MKLTHVSDSEIMQKTESIVREEREVLTQLLHHFREIERRRLFSDFKYGSLHKMLVGHFGYSDDEAYRRVAAARLLAEIPEIEPKINLGELSLAHLGLAQSHFRQEQRVQSCQLSKKSKLLLLDQISSQPIREAQRIIYANSSVPPLVRTERITVVSQTESEFRFSASKNLEKKIDELKGLLAHKYPDLSLGELMVIVCDIAIEKLKDEKSSVAHRKQSVKKSALRIRRETHEKGNHRCSNCHSMYAVEIDHIKAKALGGKDTQENLRLLCKSCNQREAIKQLGINMMEKYLNHRTAPHIHPENKKPGL